MITVPHLIPHPPISRKGPSNHDISSILPLLTLWDFELRYHYAFAPSS